MGGNFRVIAVDYERVYCNLHYTLFFTSCMTCSFLLRCGTVRWWVLVRAASEHGKKRIINDLGVGKDFFSYLHTFSTYLRVVRHRVSWYRANYAR